MYIRNLSVEPVAFLAILALFIEFPSIQDLIYTKICLRVVAKHSDIIANYGSANLSQHQDSTIQIKSKTTTGAREPAAIYFQVSNTTTIPLNKSQLPSNGRIQGSSSEVLPINSVIHQSDHSRDARELCDRMNKSAIPLAIRQEIADEDSLFWLKYQIIICLLCTISCPYWGGISDRLGRLIPLNTSILVDAASNLISLVIGLLIGFDLHESFHVNWLYVGAVLVGLSGGQAVVIVNSFGFIGDNTSNESRSNRVMILESVIYLAHSGGFLLSKYIMSITQVSGGSIWFNRHFVAFGACILLDILSSIYSICFMRHQKFHRFLNNFERERREASLSAGSSAKVASEIRSQAENRNNTLPSNDRPRELTSSTPEELDGSLDKPENGWANFRALLTLEYYRETYETATKPRETRLIILLLLLNGFLSALSLATLMSLMFVYLKMDPFNWATSQYSEWNSLSSISRGAALVVLTICMRFIKSWNVPDALVASLGFLSKGIGLIMIALADSSAIVYWSLIALIPSEFSMPPIRSLLSKLVIREELGKIYSCLAAIQSVCFLLGNVAFYLAYTTLERQYSFKISFIIVGGLQFAALIIMLIVDTTLRRRVVAV